ncbi:MAG: SAM-dependent methyltransferase [Rariglobus sp.]|jgi:tRNA (mo5U34)-methyltransferase|nr:SAM-dependent methyltransferase [Rariglobus sp.]
MNDARYMISSDRSADGLAAEAAAYGPWFHNLHLPDGTQTAPDHPLGDFPLFKWREISGHLPEDLSGWTVLDIGCNAGFYSLELAKRGALVTGLDVDPHFLRQAAWAALQFKLEDRITLRQGQIYDLAHWQERFDLVLFMGVFYHLRHPLLALDIVAEKVGRLLVFQTLTMPGDAVATVPADLEIDERAAFLQPGWPRMAFIEHSLAGDATNWWAPNHACVAAMLRSTGLEITARPGHEIYLCAPSRTFDKTQAVNRDELLSATGRALRA